MEVGDSDVSGLEVGTHEVGNLVVEVLDLTFDEEAELEGNADGFLVVVELLILWDLVLAFRELLLELGSGILGKLVL